MNVLLNPVRGVAEELTSRTLEAAKIMLRGISIPEESQMALEADYPQSTDINGVYTVALDGTNTVIRTINEGPITGRLTDSNYTVATAPGRATDKTVIGLGVF